MTGLIHAGRRGVVALALACVCLAATPAHAQGGVDRTEHIRWRAWWIRPAGGPTADYGVYRFRRTLELAAVPERLIARVSADNRFKLYVNGVELASGPVRGDLLHWRYETVDLAPALRPGRNVVAAEVWNFGPERPVAQVSFETAFVLQAEGPHADSLDTGLAAWEVLHDRSYGPETGVRERLWTYAVVGPGDIVDGRRYPWGWQTGSDASEGWARAPRAQLAQGYGEGTDGGWFLRPRELPPLLRDTVAWGRTRRVDGASAGAVAVPGVLGARSAIVVPPHTRLTVVVDHDTLTNGYPQFVASGGAGAVVEVAYAEAAIDSLRAKGHRDSIAGRRVVGHQDRYLLDGRTDADYGPLWYRTFRYVEVRVATADSALRLGGWRVVRTGYPLPWRARVEAPEVPWVDTVCAVGWRTAQLCAHETYMDCPYYEQLQYVGDTRVQALVSLYGNGDARLMRRAIEDFDQSRAAFGLTQSRYPSAKTQFIPPFSLFWIAMLHDYHLHRGDAEWVRTLLPGVEAVLAWHRRHLNARGLYGRTAWWNYVDWTPEWPWDESVRVGGVPPQAADGSSAVLTLQLAYVLRLTGDLYGRLGDTAQARALDRERAGLLASVDRAFGVGVDALLPDLPGGDQFSQHANLMRVLAHDRPADERALDRRRALIRRVMADTGLVQATFYYRFYLAEALAHLGLGDDYLATLAPWREMLALGLTTFAEKPEPTRSDCHAWSASPNYHLLSLVAGIRPTAPGFARVRIAPALGALTELRAAVPHPAGEIAVDLRRVGAAGLRAEVVLPEGVPGELHWHARTIALRPGRQTVVIE